MGKIISNGINYSGLINANGCFIDTDNVIVARTQYLSSFTYTATEDCYISLYMTLGASIELDGQVVFACYSNNNIADGTGLYLKKGQTISVTGSGNNSSYVVYGIQQGSPITFLSEYASACYSTTEREVGCWTNGKPLYQKSFVMTSIVALPSGSWLNLFNVPDIENIVKSELNRNGNNSFPIMGLAQSGGNIGVQSTTNNLNCNVGSLFTFWYTKTTDVAGSGKLTPTGFETHHYSTNEQVVGTWIDGKPLYERVLSLTFTAVTSSTYTFSTEALDHPKICSIEKIFSEKFGTLNFASYGNQLTAFDFYIEMTSGSDFGKLAGWTRRSDMVGFPIYAVCQYTKTTD